MRYLKLFLITVFFLGALCAVAKLYAQPPNREAIRARESSAQIPEAVQEAERDYEQRIKAYNEILPKEKAALEGYRNNRASTSEMAGQLSERINVAPVSPASPGGNRPADATPISAGSPNIIPPEPPPPPLPPPPPVVVPAQPRQPRTLDP